MLDLAVEARAWLRGEAKRAHGCHRGKGGGDMLDLLILFPYPQLAFEGPFELNLPESRVLSDGDRKQDLCLPAVCMSLCCLGCFLSLWPVFPGELVKHALRPGPALLSFPLLDPEADVWTE